MATISTIYFNVILNHLLQYPAGYICTQLQHQFNSMTFPDSGPCKMACNYSIMVKQLAKLHAYGVCIGVCPANSIIHWNDASRQEDSVVIFEL